MKTFLIISFLIHIILIYVIYQLFQYVQTIKNEHKVELTAALKGFLQEMRQENERFEVRLHGRQQEAQVKQADIKTTETVANQTYTQASFTINEQAANPAELPIKEGRQHTSEVKPSEYELPIKEMEVTDKIETSIEAKVFQMKAAGHSIEEIARETNRGTTEVMLMLRLSDQTRRNT